MKDARPLSPHLQIYKLPPTAMMSVLHRGTGAVLCIGTLLLVLILASAASGPDSWESTRGWVSSWFGLLVIFGFTFALYAHFCNGIRHLLWDAGHGFDVANATRGAYISFACARQSLRGLSR